MGGEILTMKIYKHYYSKLVMLFMFAIFLASILLKIDAKPIIMFIFMLPSKGTFDIAQSSKVPFVDKLLKKLYIEF